MRSSPSISDALSNTSTCCPSCGEYYNYFFLPKITIVFCDRASHYLLDEITVYSSVIPTISKVYIDCDISTLSNAKFEGDHHQ